MCPEPPDRENPPSSSAAPSPLNELVAALYQDLRRIARWQRVRLSGGETLDTTALINEAYVRLAPSSRFETRGHFLRAAAIAMHRVLVDRVREHMAQKRGGGVARVELDEVAEELGKEEA